MGNEISHCCSARCDEDIYYRREKIVFLKNDEELTYVYDFEINDKSTRNELKKAQRLKIPRFRDDWNSKYNLPEPKEMHEFATNVYENSKKESFVDLELKSPWKLLYCVRGTVLHGLSGGFYGELYFNRDNHYLLLAIKGTSTLGNVWSDVKNVGLQFDGGEIDSAFTFGEKVRELIMKFKSKPMLMITGHSLGGYLAQIITYALKYCYLDEDGSSKSRDTPCDDLKIYTVVFDSPAALKKISRIVLRDPIKPEMFLLPIVNFIVDVNIINSNSWIGPHLGQVVALKSFQDLDTPNKWQRFFNMFSSHGIKNFKDINIEEFRQVEYLPGKISIKYDEKMIHSCIFSVLNFEYLHKYIFLADMCAELTNRLPNFKLSNSCIVIDDKNVSTEEFIPRAYLFLAKYKDHLDSGKFNGKQIVDMVAFNLWRADMLEDAHELCLNEEWKQRVEQWQDGTKIGGFTSYEEMRFIGCLLHNTIPRCFHYEYHKFLTLDDDQVCNFVTTTKATLVLIVKEKSQAIEHRKLKEVKIVYLVLNLDADEVVNNLNQSALDENSQEQFKIAQLDFMENKVSVLEIFGSHLSENLPLWSILNLNIQAAFQDNIYYCYQSIASEDGNTEYNNATDFALELSRRELNFVVISSDAGMGKTTALKQIAITLQNEIPNYWIVYLNLCAIQNELHNTKDNISSKEAAIEFIRNAALAKRKEDEVLKYVFNWKVEAKEMVLLFDSLDEICPLYREAANFLLGFLRTTELQIVVTTRPQERKNLKDADVFKLVPLDSLLKQQKFILQKFKMLGKRPPSDTTQWLKRISGVYYEAEFWSFPLTLNMAITSYESYEDLEPVYEGWRVNNKKTNIFETLFTKSISKTLINKFNLHENQASGFFKEKYDLFIELIQILAICTLFHSGIVTPNFQQRIEEHCSFINRFDIANVDDGKNIVFLHRSFAEHLLAKLFVQHQQEKYPKISLLSKQLQRILFEREFFNTRKYICTILAVTKNAKLAFPIGDCVKGHEMELLQILIKEDSYELYMQFRALLRSKLNINILVEDEDSNVKEMHPLYFALQNARQEFVQKLISDGANFEAIQFEKHVLFLAIKKALYKNVETHFDSLKANINPDDYRQNFPFSEMLLHDTNVESCLSSTVFRERNLKTESVNLSALFYAIEANSVELVELLIAKNADSTKALQWAAQKNRKEIFDVIYEKYTPTEFKAERLRKAHFYAAAYGNLDIFKHLCNFPEAISTALDENGDSFLHIAAQHGHMHCMPFIFKYQQQSVDVRNFKGETPLIKACLGFSEEVVEWLLDKKADVNAADKEGTTCLHLQSERGNEHFVEILLNAGADINLKDNNGWTALFHASNALRTDIVKYLLEKSADSSLKDSKGNTCIHIAIEKCGAENVQCFLEYLSVNCENGKRETPLLFAAYGGNVDLVELLLEARSRCSTKFSSC